MALVEEESSRADAELAKAEAESVREALSWTIEDFKYSEEFREEILEGGFASYYIKYEDDQDAVKKLYPNLDFSSIIPPRSEDGVAEEDAMPAEGRTLTIPEVIQVPEATPEQRGEGDNCRRIRRDWNAWPQQCFTSSSYAHSCAAASCAASTCTTSVISEHFSVLA